MSQGEGRVDAKRGMIVVAHPDDMEFGCGGTVARWAAEGLELVLVVATDGSKGSSAENMTSEQLIKIRRDEQEAAAQVLGIKQVEFLGYPDGYLEHTLELRKDIARAIREHKPDRLITMTAYRSYAINSYINHPDHLAVGDAALAAIYPTARDRLTFPDLAAAGFEPHKVREVYVMGTDTPDVWVDIGATLDTKINALRAHVSQIADMDGMAERVRTRATDVGKDQAFEHAECFKVFYLS